MFGWGKSKKKVEKKSAEQPVVEESSVEPSAVDSATETAVEPAVEAVVETAAAPVAEPSPEPSTAPSSVESVKIEQPKDKPKQEKKGFFARIKAGLSRTRSGLSDGLADLLLGKKEIDDDLLEDIETQLLMADIGVAATQDIINDLTERTSRKELKDSDALFEALKARLAELLAPCTEPLVIDTSKKPYVILMVGVNGVGKTTTIGKMAKRFQAEGKSVMLAAGDRKSVV